MKKKNLILTLLAVGAVLTGSIGHSWAYFTTYTQAQGGYSIDLGDQTEVHEDFSAWTKHVSITNSADSQPVYIRAKAFCGSAYDLVYSSESGKWTLKEADGYYYYSDMVNGGASTDELLVKIENVPADVTDSAAFHVVVIYESTPVRYDEAGNPYGDWNTILDHGSSEGGA